jgi:uncharacterized protein RhaS with RHS repeats
MYYYRARYYDPVLARFPSEDPIKFLGGINFYAYVWNNPTNPPPAWRTRAPDYYNVTVEVGEAASVSLINFTMDRHFQFYAGYGGSVAVGSPITVTCVAGWLDQINKPNAEEMRSFTQGASGTAGAFIWVGGQKTRVSGVARPRCSVWGCRVLASEAP